MTTPVNATRMNPIDMRTAEPLTHPDFAAARGYELVAEDGPVGEVELALESPDGTAVDYLVVRARPGIWARRPVVSTELVRAVDRRRRRVYVRGMRAQIGRLPERLPIAL
jgi:hypothetical protein